MRGFFKKKTGVSITELMISGAILTGAGLFVTKIMHSSTQSQVKIKTSVSLSTYANQLLSYGRDRYLNVEDESTEGNLHTKGLCELIKTNMGNGVGLIELELFKEKEDDLSNSPTFSDAQWDKVPNWELVTEFPEDHKFDRNPCLENKNSNFRVSNYKKCFRFKDTDAILGSDNTGAETPEELKDLMYGTIEIEPMNLNPIDDKGLKIFDKLDLSIDSHRKDDVKDVGFRISTVVALRTYNQASNTNEPIIKVNSKESFFWAGNIDHCDYNGSRLSLTGGIPGSGDPTLVVNTGSFNIENDQPPIIEVSYHRSQVQTGFLHEVDGQKFIKSDVDKNVAVSCNEKWFRCPSERSSEREYNNLLIQTNFRFNRNSLHLNGNVNPRFRPEAYIKNSAEEYNITRGDLDTNIDIAMGDVKELPGKIIQQYILNKGEDEKEDEYFKKVYDQENSKFKEEPALSSPLRLGSESNSGTSFENIVLSVKDKGSENTANSFCRKVCVPASQYNSQEGNQLFKFILGYHLIDEDGKSFFSEEMGTEPPEVNCTSCYTKACDRFGLKTFGPMEKLPAEPLDSQFPECSLKSTRGIRLDTYEETTNNVTGDLKTNKCVAGRINAAGRLEYFSKGCSERLPILCYVFGEYRLYKDFGVDTTFSINSYTQYEADQKCLMMGLEFSNKERLDAMFNSQEVSTKAMLSQALMDPLKKSSSVSIVNSSSGDAYYKYVNLAKRGIFISPENSSQKGQLESFFQDSDNLESAHKEFWVGIEGDNEGFPLPHYEFLNDTINSNAERFAIHFNGGGLIQARDIDYDIYSAFKNSSSTKQGALLFHSIQHRGLLFTDEKDPSKVGFSNHVPDLTKKKAFLCAKAELDPNGKLVLSYFRSDNKTFNGDARGFDSTNNWFKSDRRRSTDINDGDKMCQSEGGIFIPPITPMGLLKAYSLVQPIHYRHTFPAHKFGGISEGFAFVDKFENAANLSQDLDPLWVALVKDDKKVYIAGTDNYVDRPTLTEVPSSAPEGSTFMNDLWSNARKLSAEPDNDLKSDHDMYGSLYSFRIDPDDTSASPVPSVWFKRKAFCINDGQNGKPLVIDESGDIVYKKKASFDKGSDCEAAIAPTHIACFKDNGNSKYEFSVVEYVDTTTTCPNGMTTLKKSFLQSDFASSDDSLSRRHYAGNFKKFIQIKAAFGALESDQRIVIGNN